MKEIFQEIITKILKPKLKENGFKKFGNTFYREEKDFLLIFDIWKSRWNTSDRVEFEFETGVFRGSYHEFMFHEPIPKYIRTNHCSMRLHSGSVLRKGVPCYDYTLTDSTKQTVKLEIETDIINSFIPFLNNLRIIEDVLIFGEIEPLYNSQSKLFVGFCLAEQGELAKSSRLISEYLNQFKRSPQNWLDRIKEECKRLNINV